MNLFKKLILPLLLLPLLFFVFSNTNQANAQAMTCVNSGVLSSTGIVTSNPTNKVFTVKLTNRAPSACTYTLAVSPKSGWTFLFHPVGNEATTLTNNSITVSANSSKDFKVRATPSSAILKTPGDYQFRVRISPSAQSEYEDLTYKIPAPAPTTYKITLKSYLDTDGNAVFKDSDECKGSVPVKITQNGTVKATKTTVCPFGNPVIYSSNSSAAYLTMTPPSGFKITGLQVKDNGANSYTTLTGATTTTTRGNATILIGLKAIAGGGGDTTCVSKPPTLKVTDPTNKTRVGLAGAERKYTIKITNNYCDDATFILSKENMPSNNWTGAFSKNNISIPKGDFRESIFSATSPSSASSGEKNITIGVRKQSQTKPSVLQNLTYIVSPKDVTAGPTNKPPTSAPTACNRVNPEITITQDKTTIKPEEKVIYTAVFKNKDTGNCSAKNLNLSMTTPSSEWNTAISNKDISMAVNETKTITITATSPKNASDGTKNLKLTVKNSGGTTLVTKNMSVIVGKNSISTAPVTPSACQRKAPTAVINQDKTAVKPGGEIAYSVTLTNNDTEKCADKKLTLGATVPNDNWKKTFSKNNLSMKAGTQIAFKLTIDSPNNASIGTKDIKLVVKNSEGTALLTQPLSFIVSENPGTVTPPVSQPVTPPITDGVTPPSGQAVLNFLLGLDGIGTTPRINIGGNKNPIGTEKNLTVQLRNPLTNAIIFDSGPTSFNYDPAQEKFVKSLDLPANIGNGTYNVLVIGAPYKAKQYPVSVNVTKGQVTNLNSPQFYMVAGNIDDEGQSRDYIDIRDYNVLMSCSIFSRDSSVCDSDSNFLLWSDLNSDGLVDQSDYTLWLKEKSKQKGDLPE